MVSKDEAMLGSRSGLRQWWQETDFSRETGTKQFHTRDRIESDSLNESKSWSGVSLISRGLRKASTLLLSVTVSRKIEI